MRDVNPPMSTAYKAVFALAIFMIFVSLLGGSKSGIGILLWGYTAWLMFKRNNKMLVTIYKTLLWFEVVAGGIGFVFLVFNSTENSLLLLYVAFIFIAIAVVYGLLLFFKNQNIENTAVVQVSLVGIKNDYGKYASVGMLIIGLFIVGMHFLGGENKSTDVVINAPVINLGGFKKDETKSYEKLNLTRGVENIKLIEARQITLQSLSDIELKEVIAVGDVQNNIKKIQQGKLTMQELSDRELLDFMVVTKAYGN